MPSMYSLFSSEDYEKAREEGLISERTNEFGERILNYTDKAMVTKGAWENPAVRICRGLIVNKWGDVVARPWEKFFNYGQPEAGELDLDAPVTVTDKVDGSLGIIYLNYYHEVCVTTRGSFNSDQAVHATKLIRERGYIGRGEEPYDITPLVEIVYPENRIVCDYGDQDDLILLGGVDIETGEYLKPQDVSARIHWSGPVTKSFSYTTLREALAAPPRKGAEGLVVRFEGENRMVKIKQEDYLQLHRIMFGMSEKVVWRHLAVHAIGGTVVKDSKHWGQMLGIGPEEAEIELVKGEEWLEEALYKGNFPDEVVDWFEKTRYQLIQKQKDNYKIGLHLVEKVKDLPAREQYEMAKDFTIVKEVLTAARTGDYAPLYAKCWKILQPVGKSAAVFARSEAVA